MWGDKQQKIDDLEAELAQYRDGNLELNRQLTEEKQAVQRLTKSYQDEVGKNGKLNLDLLKAKADLVDAEAAWDASTKLADERYDCMAALTDENADLVYHKKLLTMVLKACHIQVPKLPVRKADDK